MKHAAILLVLLVVAGLVPIVRSGTSAANECDLLAADPSDLGRVTAGVPDKELMPALAIPACQRAVEDEPQNARYLAQVGRVLMANHQRVEATPILEKAAAMGHAGAKFYLARARVSDYWAAVRSRTSERPRDVLDDVHRLLDGAGSYAPALELLDQVTLQASDFRLAVVADVVIRHDFTRANRARGIVALWARGVQKSIAMDFHPDGQECPGYLADPTIVRSLDAAVAGDADDPIERLIYVGGKKVASVVGLFKDQVWLGDEARWTDWFESIGKRDGLMMSKLRGCASPAMYEFYQSLVAFARTELPLSEYQADVVSGASIRDLFPELVPFIYGNGAVPVNAGSDE